MSKYSSNLLSLFNTIPFPLHKVKRMSWSHLPLKSSSSSGYQSNGYLEYWSNFSCSIMNGCNIRPYFPIHLLFRWSCVFNLSHSYLLLFIPQIYHRISLNSIRFALRDGHWKINRLYSYDIWASFHFWNLFLQCVVFHPPN